MPDNEIFESQNKIEEVSDCNEQSEPSSNESFEEKKENQSINTYVTYVPYGLTPKSFEEKKEIKQASRMAGTAFLVAKASIVVLSFVLVFIFTAIQNTLSLQEPLIKEPSILQAMQIFLSLTVFTLPFIIVYKIFGYKISDLISLSRPKEKTFLPFFLFGIGFCAFANIATNFAAGIFRSFGIEYKVDNIPSPNGIFGFLLCIISTVLVPAFVEEFACRGVVLGALRKFGDGFAILVSAAFFGLMHGNFQQIPFAFLVGLVLGFVTVKSASLWIAIAIHAFNNGFSVIFDFFFSDTPSNIQNTIFATFLCISMVLGIFGMLLLKNKTVYLIEEKCFESSARQRYKWFFFGAVTFIFVIISILEAMAFFI